MLFIVAHVVLVQLGRNAKTNTTTTFKALGPLIDAKNSARITVGITLMLSRRDRITTVILLFALTRTKEITSDAASDKADEAMPIDRETISAYETLERRERPKESVPKRYSADGDKSLLERSISPSPEKIKASKSNKAITLSEIFTLRILHLPWIREKRDDLRYDENQRYNNRKRQKHKA